MNARVLLLLSVLSLSSCGGGDGSSTAPPQTIVMMGDSLTSAWRIWGDLDQHLPQAIDAGVPGNTTIMMQERFQKDVLDQRPDVVVILGGTNDVFDATAINAPLPDMGYILDMIVGAQQAGARVILGTIPPSTQVYYGRKVEGNILEWNARLRSVAKVYGAVVADYYPVLCKPDGSQDWSLFEPDHIHPNTEGFQAMWPVLAQALSAVGAQ